MRRLLLIVLCIVSVQVMAMNKADLYQQAIGEMIDLTKAKIDSSEVITYESFQGNDDNELLKEYLQQLSQQTRYRIVIKDELKDLFDYNLLFSEPIFSEKTQKEPGNFTAADWIVKGTSNYHEYTYFGKPIKELNVEFKISNISQATTSVFFKKEYRDKWRANPFIILLICILMLIIMRYINQLTKGYKSKQIIFITIILMIIFLIWCFI